MLKEISNTLDIKIYFSFARVPVDPESYTRDPKIWLNAIAEPTNRRVVVATLEFLDYIEKSSFRNGKTSIEISDNIKFGTQPISFQLRSNCPFWKIFKERIQRLLEAGICPHRLPLNVLSERSKNKRYDEEIPALVLSMEDLGVGFEVCLMPLAVSVAVFVFEIVYQKVKRFSKEYLAAFYSVSVFIKIHKPGLYC